MRFISNGAGNLFNTYLDVEIVDAETDGTAVYVEKNNILLALDIGTLFEIYTPNPSDAAVPANAPKSNNILFYEFAECYDIYELNGVKYHRGSTQDQDATQPATGTFNTGDVYYRFRNFVLGGARYIEDSHQSDFYESFTTQTGRPQILDKNAKQVFLPTQIRFSNQYFSGSQVNGFSSFEALNQKNIDRVFGTIQIMNLMAQSVLLVVCTHKTQTFYVNKATINIPSNTPNLISLSDAVLNTADTLIGEWGTQHKLAFDSYDNNAWYNDQSKGTEVRYSSNGLERVSRYLVESYFNDRGLNQNSNICAGYDPYHNLLMVTWGVTDIPAETIAFNDGVAGGKNLWTQFFSFIPECYGRIGNTLLTFKDGQVWIHDSAVKNNFFGVQYVSKIKFSANDLPITRKLLQASAISGLKAWNTEATVPPNAMRVNGQRTRIKKENYKMKEGQFFREFQGDMNSVKGLINGSKLRGEFFIVEMENDATEYTELYSVSTSVTDSPYNIE
jgi:hypothetical protein